MQKLNTTLVYILSVVGLLCCCVYGLGTVAAIIAIVVASKELKKYEANPDQFVNGKAMKSAKTVAIVSLIISIIGLAIFIYIALNQCEFMQSWYDMAIENGASESDMEDLRQGMEEAGCI
ncbi:hypothetical protein LX97_00191 [Nonlabens dokdonensis]|jgi:uncharacterized membrane protein|uniref:DUF4190 domain-containing protein n=2 Tax=Nonlabens dokdonensis TaxID=328515 RepID=L7W1X3_NONDD|nr:CCC motif membrane protein [Nonlabens dokdonensis]AGC75495.1 hypothetical protein DDD_0368 [Nonlabens dokdonensis DSW-6]PZX43191.1 hypothetical protein LX97_00191 [Nonlabens dokdonensis]